VLFKYHEETSQPKHHLEKIAEKKTQAWFTWRK
jgi:hypothetical protein